MLTSPPCDRRYRLGSRLLAACATVVLAMLVASCVILIADGVAVWFIPFFVVVTLYSAWQGVDAWRHGGVCVTADGITNRRMVGYRSWRWEEIDRFTRVRRYTYLVTGDRRAWMMLGVADGRRVVWDGGETREITALLNKHLDATRQPAAA